MITKSAVPFLLGALAMALTFNFGWMEPRFKPDKNCPFMQGMYVGSFVYKCSASPAKKEVL